MNYSKLWTQFETQSLAFGLLRKALYPKFLVRGYEGAIWIYTPTADSQKPILRLIIQVHASKDSHSSKVEVVSVQEGVTVLAITGGDKAFAIVEIVRQHLE